MYALPSVIHNLLHQSVEQLLLTLKYFFPVSFKPSTTSLPCPGDPTPLSIMMLYECAKIDNKYSAVAQQYYSAQPSLFSHIVLMSANNIVLFCNRSIICLLCSDVVAESCLVSTDKNNERPPEVTHDMVPTIDRGGVTH